MYFLNIFQLIYANTPRTSKQTNTQKNKNNIKNNSQEKTKNNSKKVNEKEKNIRKISSPNTKKVL